MTENQLKYLAYQETARHNAATEAAEMSKIDETARSNRANEDIKRDSHSETVRSNLAREQENYRSNIARENENVRSNVAREAISRGQLLELQTDNAARRDLAYNQYNLDVAKAWEQMRSNMAREAETERSNKVREEYERDKLLADTTMSGLRTIPDWIDAFLPG